MNTDRILNELEKHGYKACKLCNGGYKIYSHNTGLNNKFTHLEALEFIEKLNRVVL